MDRFSSTREPELFYVSIFRVKSGEPACRIWKLAGGEFVRIDCFDGTQFWIDRAGRNIWAQWGEKSSFEDTVSYLLGPVFGFVLRMRGVICLHASAVVRDRRAFAFVGTAGAGKSTTAAAMVQRGHALLSDDIVAVAERADGFYAIPAYPMLNLWPEAVEALYGTADAAPASSENDPKRRLALGARQFASQAAPLGAVFMLEERQEGAAPRLESMTPQQALMALVANTYANLLLNDDMRAREFAFLGRLLNSVPVMRLRAHQDVSRIGELCEIVENEAASARTPVRVAAARR